MKTIEGLTEEQQVVNFETMRHIELVRNLLNRVVAELITRGQKDRCGIMCSGIDESI